MVILEVTSAGRAKFVRKNYLNSIRWRSFSVRWSSLLESIKRNGFRPIWPRICIIHHSLSATRYYIYTNISSGLRIRTKTYGQSPDKLSRRLGECTFDRCYLSWDFVRWCFRLKLYVSKKSCAIISYRLSFLCHIIWPLVDFMRIINLPCRCRIWWVMLRLYKVTDINLLFSTIILPLWKLFHCIFIWKDRFWLKKVN